MIVDARHPETAGVRIQAISLTDNGSFGPRGDLALSTELLRLASAAPAAQRLIRIYRPEPTLAFSRRESHLPGFAAAVTTAAGYGFMPVIRPTGGRAVAYDQSCLVIDVVDYVARRHHGNQEAFADAAGAIARSLLSIGVSAFVGEIPGEYCPGRFSVNARRVVKIAGISQRATSGARLTSVMMPVSDPSLLIEVLTAVNRDLEFDWDPLTFGSIDGETGSASFDDVGDAARDEFCPFGFQSVSYYRFAADIRALGGDP